MQCFNQVDPVYLKSKSGEMIKEVKNFKYLGAWTESTTKDIKVRKALAWSAGQKLSKVWESKLSRALKIRLFVATVESVLLYGSETWTMTKALTKELDELYTRMLRMALNVSWKERKTNAELYRNLPQVRQKIRERRMRLAGHCIRHDDEIAAKLVLWVPTDGKRSRGRPAITFIDNLLNDTGLDNIEELQMVI